MGNDIDFNMYKSFFAKNTDTKKVFNEGLQYKSNQIDNYLIHQFYGVNFYKYLLNEHLFQNNLFYYVCYNIYQKFDHKITYEELMVFFKQFNFC